MTPDEIRARLDEIKSRLKEIDTEYNGKPLPDGLRDEFKSLVNEKKDLTRLEKELEARRQVVEEAAENEESRELGFQVKKPRIRGEEIYDLSTIRTSAASPEGMVHEMQDRAMEAIERGAYPADSVSKEEAQGNVERLLKAKDTKDGKLARHILETGSPTYSRAFGKKLEGRELTDAESRALSTSNEAGGFAIPFTLDPSVVHASNHSVNPWRAIARVEQVVTDNWNGITSAGVKARYTTEASEVEDNSPTFKQPSIHPERADCFIPFSVELGQDWAGLQAEITSMIQEAKDDLEASKFAFGDGEDEPQGVLIGGTASFKTAGTAVIAVADVYKAEEELPPRYRPRAQWVANRSIYNRIRQFDTAGGANLWTENLQKGLANNVPTPGNTGYNLLGYQANECSTMGTTVASGGTVAVIGDFSRYVIVDRIGMSVELVPHLFATGNNRPSGQRGFLALWRNSAQVIDANAFRKIITL
jgi:HK97 family phage major capsid protein